MSTMSYYQIAFGTDIGLNLGVLFVVVLTGLLIFLELTQPMLRKKTIAILGKLRFRFDTVTWILFIIFISIVYTKVVMILTA